MTRSLFKLLRFNFSSENPFRISEQSMQWMLFMSWACSAIALQRGVRTYNFRNFIILQLAWKTAVFQPAVVILTWACTNGDGTCMCCLLDAVLVATPFFVVRRKTEIFDIVTYKLFEKFMQTPSIYRIHPYSATGFYPSL